MFKCVANGCFDGQRSGICREVRLLLRSTLIAEKYAYYRCYYFDMKSGEYSKACVGRRILLPSKPDLSRQVVADDRLYKISCRYTIILMYNVSISS